MELGFMNRIQDKAGEVLRIRDLTTDYANFIDRKCNMILSVFMRIPLESAGHEHANSSRYQKSNLAVKA
jgi:hypothetical protein